MAISTKVKIIAASTVAITGAVLLVGCSSGATDNPSSSASSSPSTSSSETRQAFSIPVTGRFSNKSSTQLLYVKGVTGGSSDFSLPLSRNGVTRAVTGDSNSGSEIMGWVEYEKDVLGPTFKMKNPVVGEPSVTINGVQHKFSVGEVWNTSQGGYSYKVTRDADTNGNKVFSFVIL